MISIVITNYKKLKLLLDCIRSVEEACRNLEYEIIISDSEKQAEAEKEIRKNFPDVRYLGFEKNIGFTRVVNEGLKKAKGDYIFVINSDIRVKSDAIKKLKDYIDKNPKIGLLGPKILTPDGGSSLSPRRFYKFPLTVLARRTPFGNTGWGRKIKDYHLMKDYGRKEPRRVDWILGEALFTKKEHINKVGILDERFFLYFSDVDWCFRFWKKRLEVVYYPEAVVEEMEEAGEITKARGRGIFSVFTSRLTKIHISEYIKFLLKYFGRKNPRKKYNA